MQIDIIRLINNITEYIDIDEYHSFDESYLSKTELLKLDNVHITGYLTKDNMENIILNLVIEGSMVLPCSLTLEPVDYPFKIEINDNLEKIYEEIDEKLPNFEKTIDILPIIWENILMEIPMKVTSSDIKDIKLSGDGWQLVTEENKEVNPELEKLKDLL
ncbi:MAG: DUF177 domain-containing protein [Bacilli bacterium]|nr:DUF177 domain-containing protein [Bacilli bacterium]MDD4608094.1 DUF177 domain-containing protein [Bacilli bacterium]